MRVSEREVTVKSRHFEAVGTKSAVVVVAAVAAVVDHHTLSSIPHPS